jgi:hypothetical protein
VFRLLVTANVVPILPILVPLILEAIHSSETSVIARATRRHTSEDGIIQLVYYLRKPLSRRPSLLYRTFCGTCVPPSGHILVTTILSHFQGKYIMGNSSPQRLYHATSVYSFPSIASMASL